MNGWTFGAVAIVCVTVAFVVVVWAAAGRQAVGGGELEAPELSADEEFGAVRAHNAAGGDELRRQIAAAAERARREREGGF